MPPVAPGKSRHKLFIGLALALVLLGGVISFFLGRPAGPPPRKAATPGIVTITLPPPPLPPPPPPPPTEPPPPSEEKMVEQEPVAAEEPPPVAAPETPPDEALGTNNKGDGPDMGLRAGGGNGGGAGGNGIGGAGKGGKYGWYASGVQASVADALRRHPATRNAAFPPTRILLWPDAGGLVTRAQLVGSTGSPATDEAIKNQILTGLQLRQPPPAGMPLPIVLRINARKP